MLYLLSALSVMYILWMYYISLLLLPPDGFVLCYIVLLVLTLWRFDDDIISPSPGKGRYKEPATDSSKVALDCDANCRASDSGRTKAPVFCLRQPQETNTL